MSRKPWFGGTGFQPVVRAASGLLTGWKPVPPGLRGFSLIEILIAILVLAIGLLGLGAVFPAVIAEQREAVETTRGVSAAATAGAMLRGSDQIVRGFDGRVTTSPRPELAPWEMLSADKQFSRDRNNINGQPGGPWLPTSLWEARLNWHGQNFFDIYRTLGVLSFNGIDQETGQVIKVDSAGSPLPAEIPVASRLIPPAFSGQDPQYVWDAVLRLDPASRYVQAAVFVRRIDTRIRTSEQNTMSDMLAGGPAGQPPAAFPVAVDNTWRPIAGDATNAQYALPLMALLPRQTQVTGNTFRDADGDGLYEQIRITRPGGLNYPSFAVLFELASQPGQKLVDNLGTVRTVQGVETVGSNDWIVIDPPYTQADRRGGFDAQISNTVDPSRAQQVVFTPQIPVAVQIVRVQE